MLNWSPGAVRATLGVGGLGMLMLSIQSIDAVGLGFWPAFVIALFPALVFAIARPDMLPERFVRAAQWTAIGWYGLAFALALSLAVLRGFAAIDLLWIGFVMLGAWPCLLAARRMRASPASTPGVARGSI